MRPPILMLLALVTACGGSLPLPEEARPSSVEMARSACVDGASCGEAARALLRGGDVAPATELLRTACDGGDVQSCVDLGDLVRDGRSGPADPSRARALYEKACDDLSGPGCHALGSVLCESDAAAALRAFQRACSRLHPAGCFRLGQIHVEGLGGNKDEERGIYFLRTGCSQLGSPDACKLLARIYDDPQGAWHEPDRAFEYLFDACEAGDEDACATVGQALSSTELQTRSAGRVMAGGVVLADASCQLQTRGSMALVRAVEGLGAARPALHACGPGGTRVRASWRWERRKVAEVSFDAGVPEAVARCVEQVVRKLAPPRNGRCEAVIILGDELPPPPPAKKRRGPTRGAGR